jgi:hypothetical protein
MRKGVPKTPQPRGQEAREEKAFSRKKEESDRKELTTIHRKKWPGEAEGAEAEKKGRDWHE